MPLRIGSSDNVKRAISVNGISFFVCRNSLITSLLLQRSRHIYVLKMHKYIKTQYAIIVAKITMPIANSFEFLYNGTNKYASGITIKAIAENAPKSLSNSGIWYTIILFEKPFFEFFI